MQHTAVISMAQLDGSFVVLAVFMFLLLLTKSMPRRGVVRLARRVGEWAHGPGNKPMNGMKNSSCGSSSGDENCALTFAASNTCWPQMSGCQPLDNAATGSPTTGSSTTFVTLLMYSRRSSRPRPSAAGKKGRHLSSTNRAARQWLRNATADS